MTDHVILSAKDTEKRDESENEWGVGVDSRFSTRRPRLEMGASPAPPCAKEGARASRVPRAHGTWGPSRQSEGLKRGVEDLCGQGPGWRGEQGTGD